MSKPAGVLGAIAGLAGFSAIAGVLATAMVAPALAVTSMTINTSIGVFDNLPSYIELTTLPQRNTLYGLRNGVEVPFAQVFSQDREEVSWDNVSPFVKNALVAGEDRRFYEHGGVDIASLARATQGYLSSGGHASSGGGSTLAMQLVKNIRVQQALTLPTQKEQQRAYNEAVNDTPARKLQEMKLAIGLEKRYTKNEILLGYLNIAGFGGNTYGIESAAMQYYSVSAKDLTLPQAASLIAIVQQPNVRNLNDPKKYPANKARRDLILDNMLELGYISRAQHDSAVKTPIQPKLSTPKNGCLYATEAQFFCDYVVKNVRNFAALGATPSERLENWHRGGYQLYTTIDLTQQAVTQAEIDKDVPGTDTRYPIGAAMSAVQAGTGRVLTMAQNKGYNNTKDGGGPSTTAVNYNTDFAYGGSLGFPTGSTYKIFTLTDWLENGHGVNEVVNGNQVPHASAPASCMPGGVWRRSPGDPTIMRNDGGVNPGPVTVRRATAQSINNAFFDMATKLDLCEIRDVAESMGVHRADGKPLVTSLSSVLGINELAPLTLAAALATISSGGTFCEPIVLDKVVGPDGKDLPGQNANCRAVLSPDVAAAAAYALGGPTGGYPGSTGAAANPRDGHALIGKTGTTDNLEHAWMLASTSKVSMVTWVGNIYGHHNLGRIYVAGGNANTVKFRMFRNVMTSIDKVYGGNAAFPTAPDNLINGITQPVPDVTGQSVDQATSIMRSLGLDVNVGAPRASALPVGTVAGTDPPAGARVSRGYSVTLYPSDGTLAVTMPDVVNHKQSDAIATLQAAGFTNAPTINWVKVNGNGNGNNAGNLCLVTSSNPPANTATSKDAAITLTVTSTDDGKPPAACP